ncbi:MAG TPA: glycosyl hydrolase family 79 C-terminal domain-containing protein [Acidobacteriaceae bacterium]|nr:glycosyl hydrolase family 79 C-terminal domain-containing protein [Acidobacteriaceae bacterium]
MRRREFLQLSALVSGASFFKAHGLDQPSATTSLRLTIDPHRTGNTIGPDFTGLSYESAQLGDPTFFAPSNTELIGLVRRLGKSGILRVGGNTSEYCYWTPKPKAADLANAAAPVNPSTGKHPDLVRRITPEAVRNLSDFIDATGWKLIYGLNMGTGTAEDAADEAAYVMKLIGPKLVSFQLCNEPDLFSRNGIRKPGYNFAAFAKQWQHFYKVIRARVPNAPFSGPDTAFNNEWLVPFAREFKNEIAFLSQHYYAEGPPTNPSMTIGRLLRPNPKLVAEFAGMAQTHKDTGLPFRMTETNSCYQGGKKGVSNTFASALWGAELMYQLAAQGGTGINFHGGGYGWYTPIAGTQKAGFEARPIYYGMLMFALAGAGQMVENRLSQPQPEDVVAAYSLKTASGLKTVLFNKSSNSTLRIAVDPGQRAQRASLLLLSAPDLASTSGVTLGGSSVSPHGDWSASSHLTLTRKHGVFSADLPAASAAIVSFEA